jgi:hypothetical protein
MQSPVDVVISDMYGFVKDSPIIGKSCLMVIQQIQEVDHIHEKKIRLLFYVTGDHGFGIRIFPSMLIRKLRTLVNQFVGNSGRSLDDSSSGV